MNDELNACEILASSNVPNKATLEPTGDNQTKIPTKGIHPEGIYIWAHVEVFYPLTSLQHELPNTEI